MKNPSDPSPQPHDPRHRKMSLGAQEAFLEMTAPRVPRGPGSPELQRMCREKGILMVDSGSTPGGLSNEAAIGLVKRLPAT